MVDIFSLIFLLEMEIYCERRFLKLSQLDFSAYRVRYFSNKLPNQIKNINSLKEFKIKFDGFTNNGNKKKLKGHFSFCFFFNGISIVMGYLMSKLYLYKNNSTIYPLAGRIRDVIAFPRVLVHKWMRMEFKLSTMSQSSMLATMPQGLPQGHFGELSDELVNRIWSVYKKIFATNIYTINTLCINSVYVCSKDFFFMLTWGIRNKQIRKQK